MLLLWIPKVIMTESSVRSLALFFYFAFLDDQKAQDAASEALVLSHTLRSRNSHLSPDAVLVAATHKVWNKYKTKVQRGVSNTSSESGWILPEGVSIGPWLEFQKSVSEEELLSVIWSKILGISETDISLGIGITEGTVRYRLARSLRKLGSMAQKIGVSHV